MASVTPVQRARGYAWRVQARVGGRMMQETFSGDDPARVEAAAEAFGKVVDRLGFAEAKRIRDARSGSAKGGARVVTLAEWIGRYMDPDTGIWSGVGAGYRRRSQRMAENSIKPTLGELPLSAIDSDDIARWVLMMEARQGAGGSGRISSKTVRNHHGLLSQILAEAEKRGLRGANSARGTKIRQTRRSQMVALTQSEFATLLHFVPPRWKALALFLAGTGMRWGEATALTWGDIDRDARPMLVHVTKAWTDDESGGRVLGPPKSEAGERSISVPDGLIRELGTAGRGDELVFPTRTGTALWSGSFWSRVWTPAVARANDDDACAAVGLTPLGKRPRVHDLRHSHASWLIAAGRPLPYIQRRLGHEDIKTTIAVYGHLMPDAQQADADAVEVALGGVLPEIGSAPPDGGAGRLIALGAA